MCEPSHSVTQFEDQDGPRTGMLIGELQSKPASFDWLKKIAKWFHFSRMGAGHSESLRAVGIHEHSAMPCLTKYEAYWWNRSVRLDGNFYGLEIADKDDAILAATDYAKRVSIGSLQQLRTFLERCFATSPNPQNYLAAFFHVLNNTGQSAILESTKLLGGYMALAWKDWADDSLRKSVARLCCGFTRQRNMLVPEWADDDQLWICSPSTKKGGTRIFESTGLVTVGS